MSDSDHFFDSNKCKKCESSGSQSKYSI